MPQTLLGTDNEAIESTVTVAVFKELEFSVFSKMVPGQSGRVNRDKPQRRVLTEFTKQ